MRVLIVNIQLSNSTNIQLNEDEFAMLCISYGTNIVDKIYVKRKRPDMKYFVGLGKIEEIYNIKNRLFIDAVLFNCELSASQQRNIENFLKVRIIDRVRLILEIFALRAKSYEGKLQVELALLTYLSSRLKNMWSHLERQKGGIGIRGGPGESQIEIDKRLINDKIKKLNKNLTKLKEQRFSQRKSRNKNKVFSISLVGYTNSGKSTIFNFLTKGNTYVANKLFATLDTLSRQIWIGNINQNIVLSDTVGFIRNLPHNLIEAFKATLEEITAADLLLHVVDTSSENYLEEIKAVNNVLQEIGATNIPTIMIYNKIDLSNIESRIEKDDCGVIKNVFVSASNGIGLTSVKEAILNFVIKNNKLK